MKAAVYYETGPPSVFRYEELPEPPCHQDGVVLDVKAVSIEGGDLLNRAGGEMASSPHIVGYQCAGTIREVGAGVSDRVVGQDVVAVMPSGSHASVASVAPAQTWPVPQGLALEQAACVPISFGTADDCLFEFGRLEAGETVLVQAGAGGVGLAAIQLAKRAGATVLATASSDGKLERLREFGLDHGINYQAVGVVAETRKITGGRGVHLVVDTVGGRMLQQSIECLAYRGRVISVGHAGRDEHVPDVRLLSSGNKALTGVSLAVEMAAQADRVRPMIARHLADVANGALRVVIDRTYPLAEASAAHEYIESRQALGRVLLIP